MAQREHSLPEGLEQVQARTRVVRELVEVATEPAQELAGLVVQPVPVALVPARVAVREPVAQAPGLVQAWVLEPEPVPVLAQVAQAQAQVVAQELVRALVVPALVQRPEPVRAAALPWQVLNRETKSCGCAPLLRRGGLPPWLLRLWRSAYHPWMAPLSGGRAMSCWPGSFLRVRQASLPLLERR